MDTDSLPEFRKHRAYVENFSALLHAERNAEMGEGDLEDRVAEGRTIKKAKLHREGSNIKVTWQGWQGSKIKDKDYVVLSCVHPHEYTCKHPFPVSDRERGCLFL